MQQSLITTNMATIVNSIWSEQYGHKRYSLIALIKYDAKNLKNVRVIYSLFLGGGVHRKLYLELGVGESRYSNIFIDIILEVLTLSPTLTYKSKTGIWP